MDIIQKILPMRNLICVIVSFLLCLCLLTQNTVLAQPTYTSTRQTDGILLGTGIATMLATFFLDRSLPPVTIDELNSLSRESVNRIDRSATYLYSASNARWSDVLVGLSGVAPAGLFLLRDVRRSAGTFSLMYVETFLLSTFIPQLCKRSIERYRPYAYNPEAPMFVRSKPDSRRSFFSGHTTSAFASAVFISTVYGKLTGSPKWNSYVWVGSLLSASVISYLRYASGAHFPTDILTGAIIGATIGFLVPALHRSTLK
jgi:membrane-associated phospholipid phosphatase